MRIVAKKILREFWELYPDCEQQLKTWYEDTEKARWDNPNQIKEDYPSASILKDNRIEFNIKGNYYRLIVKIRFDHEIIYIRFIGTHKEYDKIDAQNI